LSRGANIVANIAAFREPAPEVRDLGIFGGHDTDSELLRGDNQDGLNVNLDG